MKVVVQGEDTKGGSVRVCPVPGVRGKEVRVDCSGGDSGDTDKGRER